jgi:hypothetical protein
MARRKTGTPTPSPTLKPIVSVVFCLEPVDGAGVIGRVVCDDGEVDPTKEDVVVTGTGNPGRRTDCTRPSGTTTVPLLLAQSHRFRAWSAVQQNVLSPHAFIAPSRFSSSIGSGSRQFKTREEQDWV